MQPHVTLMNYFRSNQAQHLKKIQAYIARMPSLSTTTVKVLETCNNPRASASDLKRVISLDPVLTGRVLKLINSAYYSLAIPVTSLTRAIIMLGLNTVKNLALSSAILKNMKGNSPIRAFSTEEFWTHCLSVGVVAKLISVIREMAPMEQETFFVAGLLHDLGKIPLINQFPAEYEQVLEISQKDHDALHESEDRLLGIDHCAVGGMIAKKWRLGTTLVRSLAHHHHPEVCSDQNRDFVSVISLANQFAIHLSIGSAGDHLVDHALITRLTDNVGVEWAAMQDFRETVLSEIERAKIFLDIAKERSRDEGEILGSQRFDS
jgi:HD-like signal output (HDOD) protein